MPTRWRRHYVAGTKWTATDRADSCVAAAEHHFLKEIYAASCLIVTARHTVHGCDCTILVAVKETNIYIYRSFTPNVGHISAQHQRKARPIRNVWIIREKWCSWVREGTKKMVSRQRQKHLEPSIPSPFPPLKFGSIHEEQPQIRTANSLYLTVATKLQN